MENSLSWLSAFVAFLTARRTTTESTRGTASLWALTADVAGLTWKKNTISSNTFLRLMLYEPHW